MKEFYDKAVKIFTDNKKKVIGVFVLVILLALFG
jgi:hypothetical protein